MGQSNDDPEEFARKIEQASRIAPNVGDRTTYERLIAWIDELKRSRQQRQEARRLKHRVKARARAVGGERPPFGARRRVLAASRGRTRTAGVKPGFRSLDIF
jgi:hypothetical protein